MMYFAKLAKKVKTSVFSRLFLSFLSITIVSITIAPSIKAGHFIIDSSVIDSFLTRQLDSDPSEVWEETVKIKSDSSYIEELASAFKSKNFQDLSTNIQNAFNNQTKPTSSLYRYLCTSKYAYFEEKTLSNLPIGEIKKSLTFFLKDLKNLTQPSQFKNLVYLISQAPADQLYKQTNITTLSELIKAIGSAVSAYYEEKYLLNRLDNGDTLLSSEPLTPVLFEKAVDGSCTVISIPGYKQDSLSTALNAQPEQEQSTFTKAFSLLYLISNLLNPVTDYVRLSNIVQNYYTSHQLSTANLARYEQNNCQDALRVTPDMNTEEIKKVYHKESMKWHPDRCKQENKKECTKHSAKLNNCYEQITGKTKKK